MILADVFTGCGGKISSTKLGEKSQKIISTYKWPRSKPIKADYVIWVNAIKQLQSLYTLVLWNNIGHSTVECLHDPQKDTVYIPNKLRWNKYA